MTTLAATISLAVKAKLTGAPDVGSAVAAISELFEKAFTNGTALDQANNIYADDFTIVGAGSQTYDLAGALTNALGEACVFAAIKAIIIVNTGAAELTYGNGTNPFLGFVGAAAHTIRIPVGGFICLVDPTAAGQAVVAATGDIIKIAATDGAGTIIIVGET
jgi:hypothetical protein